MSSLIAIILFITGLVIGTILSYYIFKERAVTWLEKWRTEEESRIRKDALKRSRAALKGKVGEQIAPLLPLFEYEPSDARFIGSPVDYIIFEGDSENNPQSITFADVKTGRSSRLTQKQKEFKEVVEDGRVKWETIRLDEI